MAVRAIIESRSSNGVLWQAYIDDASWGGGSTVMKCGADGFRISYTPSRADKFAPILASTLDFDTVIENSTDEAMLTSMATAVEGRFKIKLLRNGQLYWAGILFPDSIVIDDVNDKYFVRMHATDGLAMLKGANISWAGVNSFKTIVTNCLKEIGTEVFWGSSDAFIAASIDWWETNMPTGATADPFALSGLHGGVTTYTQGNEQKERSCYELITAILKVFGARIALSNGVWRIHQITGYTNSTQREFVYSKSGALLGSSTAKSFDVTIDNTAATNNYRRQGQERIFSPRAKARMVFKHGDVGITFAGQTWSNTSSPGPASLAQVGDAGQDEGFTVKGIIKWQAVFNSTDPVFNRHKIGFIVKVGSYYLKRTVEQVSAVWWWYGDVEWTTDFAYYELMTPDFNDNLQHTASFEIIAPDVPVQDFLTIDVHFLASQWLGGIEGEIFIDEPPNTDFSWSVYGVSLLGAGQSNMVIHEATNTSNASFEWKDEVFIGDLLGAGVYNNIRVNTGSAWLDAYNWGIGSAGTDRILQLVVNSVIDLYARNTRGWDGGVINNNASQINIYNRITYGGGIYYALSKAVFSSVMDEWRFSAFATDKDITGTHPEPPQEVPLPSQEPPQPGPVIGNDGGNDGPTHPIPQPPSPVPVPQTSAYISAGNIDVISVAQTGSLQGSAGDTVVVKHPVTGVTQTFQLVKDVKTGDEDLKVYGHSIMDMPQGSGIEIIPVNKTVAAKNNGLVDAIAEPDGNVKKDDFPLFSEVIMEYPENAGTSGVAGVVIDDEGVKSYLSTAVKPIFHIKTNNRYTSADALEFYPWSSVLTPGVNGRMWYYATKDVLVVDIGYSGYQYPHGLFKYSETIVDYSTTVTTGVKGKFFVVPSRWHNLRIRDYMIGCNTYGSGSGNNTLSIRVNGSTIVTASFNFASNFFLYSPYTLSVGDVISFSVSSVKSTPPTGLFFNMNVIV